MSIGIRETINFVQDFRTLRVTGDFLFNCFRTTLLIFMGG
jgi:hypothetical protein